jgi:hypothetical protein
MMVCSAFAYREPLTKASGDWTAAHAWRHPWDYDRRDDRMEATKND